MACCLLGSVLFLAGGLVASGLDSDSDGMDDAYESFFGLNPNDASDAPMNYDGDTLSNLQESGLSTDPYASDTDDDGWLDDVDSNPLSRVVIEWGHTNFSLGDEYAYAGPAWWLTARKNGGDWTNGVWRVSALESNNVGSLWVSIDRALMTNALVYEVTFIDYSNSQLRADLLTTNGAVVLADLAGNLVEGTGASVTRTLEIPLDDYPDASIVQLRRVHGAAEVCKSLLYVDQDGDGLDYDQELQLGTSDNNADTTPPVLYCQAAPEAGNVLLNSGFEEGAGAGSQSMSNWVGFGSAFMEATQPRSGHYHAKLYGTFAGALNYSGLYQERSATTGQLWRGAVRVMTRADDALAGQNRVFAKLEFYNSSMAFLGAVESSSVDAQMLRGVYMPLVVVGAAPEGAAAIRLAVLFQQGADNAGGSIYVDDARLEQVLANVNLPCAGAIPSPDSRVILATDDMTPEPSILCLGDQPDAGAGCGYSPRVVTRTWRAVDEAGNHADGSVTYTLADSEPPLIEAPQPEINFVLNPGFEEGGGPGSQTLNAWVGFGRFFHEDKMPRSGQRHAKLFSNFSSATNLSGLFQNHATVSGDVWRVSAFALTDYEDGISGRNKAFIKIEFLDASYNGLGQNESIRLASDMPRNQYVELTASAVAPAGAAIARAALLYEGDAENSVGSIYFDDVKLERISMQPPPADPNSIDATDNCGGTVVVTHMGDASHGGNGCGGSPRIVTRTWRASDGCGNYSEATQDYSYEDVRPPVLIAPADVSIDCLASNDPSQTGTAVASGDANETITVGYSDSISSNSCPEYTVILRTWTAQDGCGNAASAVQRIALVCDSDHDGMPDCWETAHGFDSNNASDAAADADSDGLSNLEEYRQASNPNLADTDGDGLSDGDEANLDGTSPILADSDHDGMPDGWEIQHGLNPSLADAYADADDDGLCNAEECKYGTNPQNTDTDGDGVSDEVEVRSSFSDPLLVDFNGTIQTIEAVNGADGEVQAGAWNVYGNSIYALSRGGSISYSVTVPSNGYYALEVEAAQFDPNAGRRSFLLDIRVDEKPASRRSLTSSFGEASYALCFLPPLTTGVHRITVDWPYRLGDGSLRIIALRLQSYGSADANDNGQMDWLDHRARNIVGTTVLSDSLTSPWCLEGRSPLAADIALQSSYLATNALSLVVRRGVQDAWFADVSLSPTNNTKLQVLADNGWLVFSNEVRWAELNLLAASTNQYTIRAHDALLLNAYPSNAAAGDVTLSIAGVTSYVTTVNVPTPHRFASGGVYQVVGTWTDGSEVLSATVQVTAVQASFSGSPVVYLGNVRHWDNPDIPSAMLLESDPRMDVQSSILPSGLRRLYLDIDAPETRTIVARLYEQGPILDAATIRGVDVYSSSQILLQPVHVYSDGSKLVEMIVHITDMADGVNVRIEPYTSAVSLLDGSPVLYLTPDDFDENGEARVYFVLVPNWEDGVCHGLWVYQNGNNIGIRQ
ncbi:MAG TPA: hypothetical protein DCZ95_05210 [Verrucomicrobia bacterium]|nr:MAG: hypothetical protein A2X46_01940 [Lentisphaerae bacterium GWF2_57_35]HBA83476.1 hypothetical protein [Verrucomicrobiota bacterium]